jgi:hypothetical protein
MWVLCGEATADEEKLKNTPLKMTKDFLRVSKKLKMECLRYHF